MNALCMLPVVFSATENDRFQQKAMGISSMQVGWLLLTFIHSVSDQNGCFILI